MRAPWTKKNGCGFVHVGVSVVSSLCYFCFTFFVFFSPPTAESFGVSAQIGSGVVRGAPGVWFHQGSTRVLQGLRGGASTKLSTACCWGYHRSLFYVYFYFFFFWGGCYSKNSCGFPHQTRNAGVCLCLGVLFVGGLVLRQPKREHKETNRSHVLCFPGSPVLGQRQV